MIFNMEKLSICVPEVKCVGNVISAEGLKPDNSKIRAVCELHIPSCKQDVMRLLGMVKHLNKYIPNMSSFAEP